MSCSAAGLPVNHVVIVDFNQFEKLIDAVGGITVNVPENILSNRFDCPYKTEQRVPAVARAGGSTRARRT